MTFQKERELADIKKKLGELDEESLEDLCKFAGSRGLRLLRQSPRSKVPARRAALEALDAGGDSECEALIYRNTKNLVWRLLGRFPSSEASSHGPARRWILSTYDARFGLEPTQDVQLELAVEPPPKPQTKAITNGVPPTDRLLLIYIAAKGRTEALDARFVSTLAELEEMLP